MTHPATPPDPTVAWYLDAVRAHQEHDEAVLLDSWAAIGSDREEDVLALPPEPGPGAIVEVLAPGPLQGWQYKRRDSKPSSTGRRWHTHPDGHAERGREHLERYPRDWGALLWLAGPQGVRIVRDGDSNE